MRIYEMARQAGKTHKLVEWLRHNPNGVLIVHSAQERQRILKMYGGLTLSWDRMQEDGRRVFTIQSVLEGKLRGIHPQPIVAIDNLDLILPYILGAQVGPVTMTPEGDG